MVEVKGLERLDHAMKYGPMHADHFIATAAKGRAFLLGAEGSSEVQLIGIHSDAFPDFYTKLARSGIITYVRSRFGTECATWFVDLGGELYLVCGSQAGTEVVMVPYGLLTYGLKEAVSPVTIDELMSMLRLDRLEAVVLADGVDGVVQKMTLENNGFILNEETNSYILVKNGER